MFSDLVGDLFDTALRVLALGAMADDAVTLSAGDDMKMNMIDQLAGAAAVVIEDVTAFGADGEGNCFYHIR